VRSVAIGTTRRYERHAKALQIDDGRKKLTRDYVGD
jgi:hypothetical protein